MSKIDILDWFDISNLEHLKAWAHLEKTAFWPEGFIPENVNFSTNWHMAIYGKMGTEYVKITLKGK